MRVGIIYFDGVCLLCEGLVKWIIRKDKKGQFRFAALQSANAQSVLAGVTGARGLNTVVLQIGDRFYLESSAILMIFKQLDFPWSLLALAWIIPAFIRDRLYRLVAYHRYGWFGKRPECLIPDASIKERFLEG
jgi:predicted DCC family thiol-disulfide oxidoreductase YuxK